MPAQLSPTRACQKASYIHTTPAGLGAITRSVQPAHQLTLARLNLDITRHLPGYECTDDARALGYVNLWNSAHAKSSKINVKAEQVQGNKTERQQRALSPKKKDPSSRIVPGLPNQHRCRQSTSTERQWGRPWMAPSETRLRGPVEGRSRLKVYARGAPPTHPPKSNRRYTQKLGIKMRP